MARQPCEFCPGSLCPKDKKCPWFGYPHGEFCKALWMSEEARGTHYGGCPVLLDAMQKGGDEAERGYHSLHMKEEDRE